MKCLHKIPIEKDEIVEFHRLAYLMGRYNFICKEMKDKDYVSPQQRLRWNNLFNNYKIAAYDYRDGLFIKYDVPVDEIAYFNFNIEESCLDFNLKGDKLDD